METSSELGAVLARQIEPAIRMLISVSDVCSDETWARAGGSAPVWQHVLHTAYYLQKWMRTAEQPFQPPAFATEAAVNLIAPAEPAIPRDLLRIYIQEVAEQSLRPLRGTDSALLLRAVPINGGVYTLMDQTLGQVRHLMYHVGCISIILRRGTGQSLPWVGYDRELDTATRISV